MFSPDECLALSGVCPNSTVWSEGELQVSARTTDARSARYPNVTTGNGSRRQDGGISDGTEGSGEWPHMAGSLIVVVARKNNSYPFARQQVGHGSEAPSHMASFIVFRIQARRRNKCLQNIFAWTEDLRRRWKALEETT